MKWYKKFVGSLPRSGCPNVMHKCSGAHPATSFALPWPIILRWCVTCRWVRVLPGQVVIMGLSVPVIVFHAEESELRHCFRQVPARESPMIWEALPATVTVCGRLRPPSRSSTSGSSVQSPRRNFSSQSHVHRGRRDR